LQSTLLSSTDSLTQPPFPHFLSWSLIISHIERGTTITFRQKFFRAHMSDVREPNSENQNANKGKRKSETTPKRIKQAPITNWWRIISDLGWNSSRTKMGMNPKTKMEKMEYVDWGFLRNGRKSLQLEKVPRQVRKIRHF